MAIQGLPPSLPPITPTAGPRTELRSPETRSFNDFLPRLTPTTPSASIIPGAEAPAIPGRGLTSVLTDAVAEARAHEAHADQLQDRFVEGDPSVGMHEVLIAGEKAGVALRYAITLKNRAVEAYREILNTPV